MLNQSILSLALPKLSFKGRPTLVRTTDVNSVFRQLISITTSKSNISINTSKSNRFHEINRFIEKKNANITMLCA